MSGNSSKNNKKNTTTTTTTTTSTTSTSSVAVSGPNDSYINMCPDGHACDNDASCVESLLHENKYVCDCHDAYLQLGKVYTGLSCQHVATEYCTESGEISQISFCANQGTCKSKVQSPTAAHPGCNCPQNYDGEHCQYVRNSVPTELSYFLDGTTFSARFRPTTITEGSGISPAAIVVPILAVVCGILGYVMFKYRGLPTLFSGKHVVDKSKRADENLMNVDGSSTFPTKKNNNGTANSLFSYSQHRRNSTPAFSSTHKAALMEPPDFEDLLEQSDHVKFHMDPTGSATHKLFASDPGLIYNHTMETTGSGSPTNNNTGDDTEEYNMDHDEGGLEDYDMTSPSKDDQDDDVAAYDPTFT